MASAQDIFDSLMKDPNHYFQGVEAVEQEAKRRVRQHDNNEKALSMAIQNSAVDKLSTFLRKAMTPRDNQILANRDSIQESIDRMKEVLQFFDGEGWGNNPPAPENVEHDQRMQLGENTASLYDIGKEMLGKNAEYLQQMLTGLSMGLGVQDTFQSAPAIAERIERLLIPGGENAGTVIPPMMELVERFADHPFVKSENERIQALRTTGDGDPDPVTNTGGDGGGSGTGGDPDPITTNNTDANNNTDEEVTGGGGDPIMTLGRLNDTHYQHHHVPRSPHPMLWRSPSDTQGVDPYLSASIRAGFLSGTTRHGRSPATSHPPLIQYSQEIIDNNDVGATNWEWTEAARANLLPDVLNKLYSYKYTVGNNPEEEPTDKIFRTEFLEHIIANMFKRNDPTNPDELAVNNFANAWASADLEGEDERWAEERANHQLAWDKRGTPEYERYINQEFRKHNQIIPPTGLPSPFRQDGYSLENLNRVWESDWPFHRRKMPYVEANLAGDFPDHMDLENRGLNELDPERRFFTVKNFDPNIPEDERTFHPLRDFVDKKVEGEALRNMITKLREAYVSMHVPRYKDREVGSDPADDQVWLDYPTLGNHPDKEPMFNHDDRENWNPEQKHAFNRIMFNKSLIEQYLHGLVGLASANIKPHWGTDIWPSTDFDNRSAKAWQGEWMSPRYEIFKDAQASDPAEHLDLPNDGNHLWNEVFLGRSGQDSFFELGTDDNRPAFLNGYPNFADIPVHRTDDTGRIREKNWRDDHMGFDDDWNHVNSFAGRFGIQYGNEYHAHYNADMHVREFMKAENPEFFTAADGTETDANWDAALRAYKIHNGIGPDNQGRGPTINYADFGGFLTDPQEEGGEPRWKSFVQAPVTIPPTGQAPTGQAPTGQAPTGQAPTEQAGTEQAGTGTGQPPTGELSDEYKNKINELLNKTPHLDETEADYYRKHLERLARTDTKSFDKIFERDYINANKNRKGTQDTPDLPDLPDAEKQMRDIKAAYHDIHGVPPDSAFMDALGYMDPKKLTTEHKQWVDNLTKHKVKTQEEEKRKQAEHFMSQVHSQIPHKDTLTHKDLITHFRLLYQAQAKYSGANKETDAYIAKLLREDYALAQMAGIDLEQVMQEDSDDSQNHGNDLGTEAQFKRREEQSVEDAHVQAGHRTAVSEGAEARKNPNYKPHIVARYTTNGDFLSYHNLQTEEPLDPAELRFDENNHHIFHGLDPERVKKYLQFKQMMKQRKGELHTSHVGDDELEELRRTVDAPDYNSVRDRVDGAISMAGGKLPTAKEIFNKKFGANNKPVRLDGTEEFPPIFYRDGYNDPKSGWYHPESESWINPHRYKDLVDSMKGEDGQVRQGSGRVVVQGQHYYGRDINGKTNPKNHIYSFAVPTQAKQHRLKHKQGHQDQSYYIDHTGGIAHVDSDFNTNNQEMRSHTMPQTHNEVIHDWYSQQLQNHAEANPNAFKTAEGQLRDVAIVDAPPTIQNMYFLKKRSENRPPQNIWGEVLDAVREASQEYGAKRGVHPALRDVKPGVGRPTGLGRATDAKAAEEGRLSALAGETGISDVGGHIQEAWREYQKTPIGQRAKTFVEFIKDYTTQMHQGRHPFSPSVTDPLSREELGFTGTAPSPARQVVEGAFDTLERVSSTASSIARSISGQNTASAKISRQKLHNERMGRNVERKLRDWGSQIKVGEGLSHPLQDTVTDRFYVAPGEQQKRNEKHEELKNHFGKWANHFSNARRQAIADGNQELADIHQQDNLKYQKLGQELGELDPKLPTMWQDTYIPETGQTRQGISRMHQEHIGSDISAPPRSVSDTDLSQPTPAQTSGNPFAGSSPYNTKAPSSIPFGQFSGPPNHPTPKSASPLGSSPYNTPAPTSI